MKHSRYLVSGATGFIGRALVRALLEQGNECSIVTRRKLSKNEIFEIFGSSTIEVILEEHLEYFISSSAKNGYQAVIHLASNYVKEHESGDIRNLLFANNTLGVLMLEAAVKSNAKFLFTSSYFEYDSEIADTLYTITKKTFHNFVNYFLDNKKIRVIECILYDTYGPKDNRSKLINLLINSSITKEKISIGNPNNSISVTYIDDIVSGILCSLNSDISAKFILSNLDFITVRQLSEMVSNQFEIKIRYSQNIENPTKPNILKFQKPNGWHPIFDLKSGLLKIKESMEMNQNL